MTEASDDEEGESSSRELLNAIGALRAKVPDYWPATGDLDHLAYVIAGNIAHTLVRDLETGATSYFGTFFEALDQMLVEPTPAVRDLLVVGFLEDLQNISLNTDIPLDRWEGWLGSETTVGWRIIKQLWDGKASGRQLARYIDRGSEARTHREVLLDLMDRLRRVFRR